MLEQEIFPQMVKEGKLYGLPLKDKFWFDTGKPEDYLTAQGAYLHYHKAEEGQEVLIDKSAVVE
jgi:NDP-sugar pyrophosphorylase family protein